MSEPLMTPQQAQAELGISARSTFWDVVNEHHVERIEYTSKCIRFPVRVIKALKEKCTVRGAADRARLADGRRS